MLKLALNLIAELDPDTGTIYIKAQVTGHPGITLVSYPINIEPYCELTVVNFTNANLSKEPLRVEKYTGVDVRITTDEKP